MSAARTTTVLCILDGFGLNPRHEGNAVAAAQTPNFDELVDQFPSSTLVTHGERVGLPEGQMGNSEVGHLNIGAGRVVEQWLVRISRELREGVLGSSPAFQRLLEHVAPGGTLHLIGLYSDGGVHSHAAHLHALIEELSRRTDRRIAVHLITDGRDTSPHRALEMVPELEERVSKLPNCTVATVCGRFYAMDRDKRWERVERAYRAIVGAEGAHASTLQDYIQQSYQAGVTDEFLEPAIIEPTPFRPGDGVIFWNFRADRMREIVSAIALDDFPHFARVAPPTGAERTLCFTEYDETFHLPFLFQPMEIRNYLGSVVSAAGLTQLRTAETEKYPHVTYFLDGGNETTLPGEERALVPSPRDVKTYDLKPEMSAREVCQVVVDGIKSRRYDLIVVNFANCDMVGHTGVFEAAVAAVETVDQCLGQILRELDACNGRALVLADHGNAEQMIEANGSPHTAHTTNPVPVILVNGPAGVKLREGGALCDVAPTILKMMHLDIPSEMQGSPLY